MFIIHPDDSEPNTKLGGKARNLAALRHTDIAIPAWFVLSPAAFDACLSDTQRRELSEVGSDGDVLTLLDTLTLPAHIRAALLPVSLSIPVAGGRMALGTWQGIYLFEHRSAPHRRQIVAHLA